MNFGLGFADPSIGYTSTNELFCAANLRVSNVNFNYPRIWRGTSGTLPLVYGGLLPGGNVAIASAIAGLGGDIVFAEFNYVNGGSRKLYVLSPASGTPTQTYAGLGGESGQLTRLDRFGRGVVWQGPNFGRERRFFPSYRAATSIVWPFYEHFERRMAGVTTAFLAPVQTSVHVITPSTGATISTAAFDTLDLVSDAQTRSVAAGRERLSTTLRFSEDQGATWIPLAPPSGVSANAIAVIVRETP